MQIKINLRIFIFIIIFCLTRQIEVYGILMLFAFLHELGHLFAGVFLGFKPQSLSINPLGLAISFRVNADDFNTKVKKGHVLATKKLIIALCGPLVNLLLAVFFSIFNIQMFNIESDFIVYSNLLICLFNLIPIYPLDGGRIMKNILHIFTGLESSYSYINLISNISIIILTVLSSISIVYLQNIAILFILAYLWYLVISENKLYNQRLKIYSQLEKRLKSDSERNEYSAEKIL